MILSLDRDEFKRYCSKQLNSFFPDQYVIDLKDYTSAFNLAIDRLEYCFDRVISNRYKKDNESYLNHLYSDHYVMYIWFLSNTIWKETDNDNLASKLYYLNKTLHSFDCMYNTKLPNIFLAFHNSGTMLGKADYSDYFVALQGCTVGSHKGKYPKLGKGVSLTAHSSIIGDCEIGDRVSISAYTSIFEKNVPNDSVAFKNILNGAIEIKPSQKCYAQQFFYTDLKTL
jgi:serine O-acetyltransferase